MYSLQKEQKQFQEGAVKEILESCDVGKTFIFIINFQVLCTNTSAADKIFEKYLKNYFFDLVVVDECAQALEMSCWIPLLKGKRAILAGDHKQLAPTIKSKDAEKKGLGVTLFDRLMSQIPEASHLLRTQYRMNEKIMNWSSTYVYDKMLLADETVANWQICEDSSVLYFLNTAGCSMWESSQKKTEETKIHNPFVQLNQSKFNLGEVDLVHLLFHQITDQGIKEEDIGIITPYNAQVNALKNKFDQQKDNLDKIEINTVDGFQGREKMVIIISMVRSNKEKVIGFLNDYRRMNVAITRAQRLVCLIGDGETVQSDQFLHDLVDYFTEFGEVHSAMEFYGDSEIRFGIGENSVKEKPVKIRKERKKKEKKKKETEEIKQQKIEEKQEIKSNFETKIQAFLNSNEKELQFEGLNAFERLMIHELAEKYELKHQSIGEGQIKNIVIAKTFKETKIKKLKEWEQDLDPQETQDLIDQPNVPEKVSLVQIQKCEIPKKQKKKKEKKKEKQDDDLDDDAYLDALLAQNEVCNFGRKPNSDNLVNPADQPKCTAKVKLMGQTCPFCYLRYCLKHSIPEIHGCADAASKAAKLKVLDAAERRQRQSNEFQSDYLKKKLQKKIDKKVSERKSKNPKKDNKK